jgi:hypothetical protein
MRSSRESQTEEVGTKSGIASGETSCEQIENPLPTPAAGDGITRMENASPGSDDGEDLDGLLGSISLRIGN